jgi:alcohol dehydrogenase (NADP+)
MPQYDKYTGFQVQSPDTWTEFHKNEFVVKPFGDYDVEIKIEACGVCSSDIHTVSGGWGDQHFPLAVGHGNYYISLIKKNNTQGALDTDS